MVETDEEVIARVIDDLSAPPSTVDLGIPEVDKAIREINTAIQRNFLGRPVTQETLDSMQSYIGELFAEKSALIDVIRAIGVKQDRDDPTRVILTFYPVKEEF